MDANEYKHFIQHKYFYTVYEHIARITGNGNITLVLSVLIARHNQFIMDHGNPNDFTLKYAYIENATGLTKKTVQRVINKLEKCGLISKEATAVRNKGQDVNAPFIKKTRFTINYELLAKAYSEDLYQNKIYSKDIKTYMEKCPTIDKIRSKMC
jgi:hypothetical protein